MSLRSAPPDAIAAKRTTNWFEASLTSPAVILSLLMIGVVCRCQAYLACPSYWYDESFLVLNVVHRPITALLGPLDYQVIIPPVVAWLLRGIYVLVGSSELAMRLPAFVAGLLGLLVMIPLARRVVGGPGWVVAFALAALSYHAVIHGNEVRPYSCDLFLAELLMLYAATSMDTEATPRARRCSEIGLDLSYLLTPWISLPSVLVLAGISLALLVEKETRRRPRFWIRWWTRNVALLVSYGLLWYFSARHMYYPGLQDHWGSRFIADYSLGGIAVWIVRTLVDYGNFITTGMGAVLLVFAMVGLCATWSRSRGLVLMLVMPVFFAMAAASIRRYPFGDRLVLFAAPSLWLPAAAGMQAVWRSLPERRSWAWVGPAILVTIFAQEVVRTGMETLFGKGKAQYREAFAYVHNNEQDNDRLLINCAVVHETYYGKDDTLLDPDSPPANVAHLACESRLWMVVDETYSRRHPILFDQLRAVGCSTSIRKRFVGLDILLCTPPVTLNQVKYDDSGSRSRADARLPVPNPP